jgi:defect-in-organelle-trafficking protein DotD
MNSWKLLILPSVLSGALLLSSCSKTENLNYSYVPTSQTPVKAVNANTQQILTTNSEHVKNSMDELAAIQKTLYPNIKLKAPIDAKKAGLSKVVSIDFSGPVEDLLNQIAKVSHYKLNVLGVKPSIPALVSITMKNVTIADVLRNAMLQVVKKADITVYPTQHIIELRYYHI